MRALSEAEIRGSFVNATPAELEQFELPIEVLVAEWERLDALAWRDRSNRRLGYLVTLLDDEPVGIVLRAAETTMSRHRAAICNLCHTQQPADQVTLFSARRAGPAGAKGDSLGSYLCADLSCQENVRLHAPLAPAEVRDGWQALRRIEGLARRTRDFVANVRG
ncbi:FBP domain-containing protein [Agromyces soli]|uniref:FBP domain-containing protein n=1 Tax=Agromyces soli TaxID=659012 RepID=A0ABY4AXS9_9MICO|nr:FBP domain-containing protein [Agromyces soli]UOE26571.1 FBP domain-containing protein [Agromyces soli]